MQNIRYELDTDESIDPDIPFRQLILGEIVGITLNRRGLNDPHVCFSIISEDDTNWSLYHSGSSSYWIDDYIRVLQAVEKWCHKNCDPDMHESNRIGWKFRN